MPITNAVPIGSHASIPVRLPDGTPFGMFCCLSPRTNPTLNGRDLETMRVFAGLATKQVHAEIEQRRAGRDKRATLEAIIQECGVEIAFQPIVSLLSMEVVALEGL